MKRYTGRRAGNFNSATVYVWPEEGGENLLDPKPSQKVYNHSPDGFEWGYGGSGPAQLALALLLDHGLEPGEAVAKHQGFKFAVVGRMPFAGWELTSLEIDYFLVSLNGGEPDEATKYFAAKWDGAREEGRQ